MWRRFLALLSEARRSNLRWSTKRAWLSRVHTCDGLGLEFFDHWQQLKAEITKSAYYHLPVCYPFSSIAQRSFIQQWLVRIVPKKGNEINAQEDRFQRTKWRERVKDGAQLFQFSKKRTAPLNIWPLVVDVVVGCRLHLASPRLGVQMAMWVFEPINVCFVCWLVLCAIFRMY